MLSFVFSVGSPPQIIEGLKDVIVTTPNDATLECQISSGKPSADVSWYIFIKYDHKTIKCSICLI